MLLLDHNLPHQLRDLLSSYGLKAESTAFRGWELLKNGDLVSAAHAAGFTTILTRDVRFAESAAKALPKFPAMAIVVIRLPQRGWRFYLSAFQSAWAVKPIQPISGQVTEWP